MSAIWNLTRATLQQLASPVTRQKTLLFLAVCLASLQNTVMAELNDSVLLVPHGGDKELTPNFMIMIVLICILGLVFFGGCIAGVAILFSSRGNN